MQVVRVFLLLGLCVCGHHTQSHCYHLTEVVASLINEVDFMGTSGTSNHNRGRAKQTDLLVEQKGSMTNVFVYGTLKKGQPNHHYMIDGTKGKGKYCGKGCTDEKYPLVIAGKYNIPFLLNVPGMGQEIAGEIYLVDDQLLQFLDEFESCPEVYQRRPVGVRLLEWEDKDDTLGVKPGADGMLTCFLYSTNTYDQDWLKLPYYNNYDPFGMRGQPKYVLRESR